MKSTSEISAQVQNIRTQLAKPVVLIGMMGSGKSTLAVALADVLGVPLHDSDRAIEREAGCTISEFFDRFGEAAFRKCEEEKIVHLLTNGVSVISTGGGAAATPAILSAIKAQGISLWLDADPQVLYDRVKAQENRPLLRGPDPLGTLRDLLEKRRAFYRQADIRINANTESPAETLALTINSLSDYLNKCRV